MTHNRFIFHFQKALQAAAYLLRLAGGRMRYIDLLKMLYIADRECLAVEGETITGDSMSALKYGPVLRTVFNLIKEKDSQSARWQHHIETDIDKGAKRYDVFIANDPGEDELYLFEKEILNKVFAKYRNEDVIDFTHTFPEWKKYEKALRSPRRKNSYPITLEDVLDGIGKPEMLETVENNIADEKYYSELFAG